MDKHKDKIEKRADRINRRKTDVTITTDRINRKTEIKDLIERTRERVIEWIWCNDLISPIGRNHELKHKQWIEAKTKTRFPTKNV